MRWRTFNWKCSAARFARGQRDLGRLIGGPDRWVDTWIVYYVP